MAKPIARESPFLRLPFENSIPNSLFLLDDLAKSLSSFSNVSNSLSEIKLHS
jgi:hypothetical protein